jgi:List-Bact-rpt repeat protein
MLTIFRKIPTTQSKVLPSTLAAVAVLLLLTSSWPGLLQTSGVGSVAVAVPLPGHRSIGMLPSALVAPVDHLLPSPASAPTTPLPPPLPPTGPIGCYGIWPATVPTAPYAGGCQGHDEATLSFYSNASGSGGNVSWSATLPVDASATQNQSDLYSAVWFGLPATAASAWLGECFLEAQLYPDASWSDRTLAHPAATDNGNWIGRVVGWQIDLTSGREDTCFSQPLYRTAPGTPQVLNLTQGDRIRVQFSGWAGSAYGENVTLSDLTTGNSSSVTAFNASDGGPIRPAYGTSAYEDSILWSPGGGLPASMGFELGRGGNPTIPSNSSFLGCSPGVPPATALNPSVPCPSYDPSSWANDTRQPWVIGAPTFGTGVSRSTPAQVGFSDDLGGAQAITTLSNGTCLNRVGSSFCTYPWFSYSCPTGGFDFGATDFAGVTDDFGQQLEYAQTPHTNALGLTYFPATNFSLPTCARPSATLSVGTRGSAGGSVDLLSQVVAPVAPQLTAFAPLALGAYSIHALAPAGGVFSGWSISGAVQVAAAASPWTTVLVSGNGTVTATFAASAPATTVWFNGTGGLGSVAVSRAVADRNGTALATVVSGGSVALPAGLYTIEAYPPPGSLFGGWSVDGAGGAVGATEEPVTWLTVTGATPTLSVGVSYTISPEGATVVVRGVGNGTVTFNGAVVPYTPSNHTSFGVYRVAVGAYPITASPAAGWTFLGWVTGPSGVETDYGAAANVTLENGTTNLSVSMGARVTFVVSPAADGLASLDSRTPVGNGTVTIQPLGGYFLDAIPFGGFAFKRWSVNDPTAAWVLRPGTSQSRLQLNASVTITLTFQVRSPVNLTFHIAPVGAGTLQFNLISAYSDGGSNSTLTNGTYLIAGNAGARYRFTGWSVLGPLAVAGNLLTVTGSGGALTAHFALRFYAVTFVATSGSPVVATISGIRTINGQTVHLPRGVFNISASVGVNTTFVGWASSLPVSVPPPFSSAAKLTVQTAGSLTALTVPYAVGPLLASRAILDVGSSVTITAVPNGTGPFTYGWLGLPAGCLSTDTPAITCVAPTAGTLSVRASVTGPAGVPVESPALALPVVASPAVSAFTVTPPQFDLGGSTIFQAAVVGGVGPFAYQYLDLPAGCSTVNSSTEPCTPNAVAINVVELEATDALGESAFANATVTVSVAPSVASFLAAPSPVTIGVPTTLTVTVAGGTGPFSYVYAGLPVGCASSSVASLACTPGLAGTFTVNVTATDADHAVAQGSVTLAVNPAPTITGFSASPATVGFGSSTVFSVTALGGTAPLSYAYANLPPGCASLNASSLECTPGQSGSFAVRVTVADRFGVSASSTTSLNVTTTPGGKGPAPGGSSYGGLPWWVWAALIAGILLVLVAVGYRMRKRPPAAPAETTATLPPREYVPPPDGEPSWTESSASPQVSPSEEPPP